MYRWPGEATASAPVGGAPRACPRGPLAQGLSAGGAEGRTTGSWSLHRTRLRPWADLHFALQGPQVWWGSEPRRRPPAPPLDSVLALQSSRRALRPGTEDKVLRLGLVPRARRRQRAGCRRSQGCGQSPQEAQGGAQALAGRLGGERQQHGRWPHSLGLESLST